MERGQNVSVIKGTVFLGVCIMQRISSVVGPLARLPGTQGTLRISSCVGTALGILTRPGSKEVRTSPKLRPSWFIGWHLPSC